LIFLDNQKPYFITSSTIAVIENTKYVSQIKAYDPDGESITYSLRSIGDSSSFTLDRNTGVLTLRNYPDFETISHAYTLKIRATTPSNQDYIEQVFTINIKNSNLFPH
jgi:hypothetical protein